MDHSPTVLLSEFDVQHLPFGWRLLYFPQNGNVLVEWGEDGGNVGCYKVATIQPTVVSQLSAVLEFGESPKPSSFQIRVNAK